MSMLENLIFFSIGLHFYLSLFILKDISNKNTVSMCLLSFYNLTVWMH